MSAHGACGLYRGAVSVERDCAGAVLATDYQSGLPSPCNLMRSPEKPGYGCREQKARDQKASNG